MGEIIALHETRNLAALSENSYQAATPQGKIGAFALAGSESTLEFEPTTSRRDHLLRTRRTQKALYWPTRHSPFAGNGRRAWEIAAAE